MQTPLLIALLGTHTMSSKLNFKKRGPMHFKKKKIKVVSVFTALICIRIFSNLLFGLLREISLSLYIYILSHIPYMLKF
jgi:hypothetical protein